MEKKPPVYCYPAVFNDGEGFWSVRFPDLENAFTTADTLDQAILEAKTVLKECLYFREESRDEIPQPTPLDEIRRSAGDALVQLVVADMAQARREMSQRAVKKTLSIPYWMEEELKKVPTLNVSGLLQQAVIKELNLKEPYTAG